MSKRKADFGSPEKENKRPKTFSTPTASRSYRDEWKNGNPWLCYDAKSKTFALCAKILYSYMNGGIYVKKLLAQCLRFFGENGQKSGSNLALS